MVEQTRVLLVGGVDVAARVPFARYLAGHGLEVELAGTDPSEVAAITAAGLPAHHYKLPSRPGPADVMIAIPPLRRLIRARRPHIVHTFDTGQNIVGRLAAVVARSPVVIGTVTGQGILAPGATLGAARLGPAAAMALSCRLSTATIFQNESDRADFLGRGWVSRRRAVLIPGSGVDTDRWNPGLPELGVAGHEIRRELGIDGKRAVVTTVTRVRREKGVLVAARAAQILRAQGVDAVWLLVGGEDTPSSLTDAERAEIERSLTWVGPRSDIPAVLAATDLFVLPSMYGEGVNRGLLEAASMAVPIVTTDRAGCREVVGPDNVGQLVPPEPSPTDLATAVAALLRDRSRAVAAGRAGRDRVVAHFSNDRVFPQVLGLYQRLLDHDVRTPAELAGARD